jgi:cellulose synthase/poly-beta-1,6-N-acetylglucosamine synthase-like glycosyltransferase
VQDPHISVLLPARNAARTLPEALEGLFAQRGAPPWELVCVDDGSTDGTAEVLERAARTAPRCVPVRIVRGEGRGLVAALNLGLAGCRGALIARMDADDRVHEDRLRLQAELLARRPALGAAGSLVRMFPEPLTAGLARLSRWLDSVVAEEDCANARFIEAPLVHPSITFRRAALDAVGGFHDRGWAEDWDVQLRLVAAGFALAKVPQVLLDWRDGPQRLTRTHPAYAPEAMRRLRAHFLAHGPLRGRPLEIWGAGPTGKRLARALEAHGIRPRRFFDVALAKRSARGAPVVPARELGPPSEALLVCAVGAAGAREEIRGDLFARGFREGQDFLFAA